MKLEAAASKLANRLFGSRNRVVFAESCTAGLVSAALAVAPGISAHHCGAFVAYRERSKQDWLGVSAADLRLHSAVSAPVAETLALAALAQTAEANYSASVTGHLGPEAPRGLDGVVFVAVARRRDRRVQLVGVWRKKLRSKTRVERQREAALHTLERLQRALGAAPKDA